MEWTTTHDMLLCREILVEEFYRFKKGSNERGRIWTQISQNLNSVAAVKFKVNQRAVRERFDLLIGRFRQQSKEEAKASGVSPEQTELDALLEEISERQKLAESTRESCSSKNVETDRKKAEEIRTQALERVGATKKRANEDCERKPKRQRRSGADVTEFIREKSEKELKIRKEELALKAKEIENEKEKHAQMFQSQEAMIANMSKQQDQMQTLQIAFLQQQQQQTQAMMALLEKFANK
ncbi:uncharacterized protein [Acropora muricata]|uniref:uncharacterized protein LOC114947771 n=1 Tax=Acropora millepora TaxID=45264 RepID=UPI001CF5F431|nr:uncharacterized protein LOC114947771 [Acropora millepora]